ncbi:MAG TPA: nuclear transport factor 2 family protein [Thermoplasmata archaeon]|nr:nuclear transport factor 2 family protein [Thermoplasmata archaeon]
MGEKAKLVEQGIKLFNEAKINELMDLYDSAAEVESAGSIIGGNFRGKEGVAEWFKKIASTYSGGIRLQVENLYEAPDAVFAEWNFKGKLANGQELEGRTANVFEFRGDKVAKHRLYTDTESLARAMEKM